MVFLAILAVFSVNARRNIPPRSTNRLAFSTDPFLYQARYSPIDWHPYDDKPFLEARQSGRPLLLFIGSPFSELCRKIDADLEDESLAAYITRNFVPVRIDGRLRPEWGAAILPLQQLMLGVLPEAQIWVLDPEGRVLAGVLQIEGGPLFSGDRILQELIEALRKYEDTREHPGDPQAGERGAMLAGSRNGIPSFAEYAQPIGETIQTGDGRLPTTGQQEPLPNLVRFLATAGREKDLARFLDRTLYSNLSDGLDGGLYRLTLGESLERNPFDKDTAQNAEAAAILAQSAALSGREDWRRLAESAFDWVMQDAKGGFSPGRVGDEGKSGRSRRSSFPSYRVRDLLQDEELDYARNDLGLSVSDNPLMDPHPVSSAAILSPLRSDVRAKLLQGTSVPADMINLRLLDVEGAVAARMIEAARMLGGEERLQKALVLSENLRDYADEDRLLTRLGREAGGEASLYGYLAYADANLQDYLASGNVPAFERGLGALRMALKKFSTGVPGAYVAFRPNPDMKLGVLRADVPEISDTWIESLTARALRLQHAYGRLLRPSPEGIALETGAQATMNRFADLALSGRARTAGYFAAAAAMVDDDFALAIGPRAIPEAEALQQKCPMRLVAPAYGPVRPDLQGRTHGLYIVRGSRIEGPFGLADAAQRLTPTLKLGIEQSL